MCQLVMTGLLAMTGLDEKMHLLEMMGLDKKNRMAEATGMDEAVNVVTRVDADVGVVLEGGAEEPDEKNEADNPTDTN